MIVPAIHMPHPKMMIVTQENQESGEDDAAEEGWW